jgi:dephospho-CoA kinase
MAVYGLTGGIGTGKSTVCRLLQELGVAVVFADEVGRQVVAKGSEGLAAIVSAFGQEILDSTAALDRKALGALVFRDPDKRRQLEGILHPLVKQHSQAIFQKLIDQGEPIVVYESALLFESRRHLEMRANILVTASEARRVARVQQRDGSTEDDVRARMKAQMDETEKRRMVDYVLDNNGDLDDLRKQVQALVATLRESGVQRPILNGSLE